MLIPISVFWREHVSQIGPLATDAKVLFCPDSSGGALQLVSVRQSVNDEFLKTQCIRPQANVVVMKHVHRICCYHRSSGPQSQIVNM